MKIKKDVILLILLSFSYITNGQEASDNFKRAFSNINQSVIKAQLGFIASDWMEGRKTGEKGEFLASDYIASQLQLYGVAPGGDYSGAAGRNSSPKASERSYFQYFNLVRTSPGQDQKMAIISSDGSLTIRKNLDYNIDFSVRMPDENIEIEAPVVFAGYGFISQKLRYNDFSKLDLKGKFILRISGFPGFAKEKLSQAELSSAAREVETTARQMGAIGIIEINPSTTVSGSVATSRFINMSPAENRPVPSGTISRYSLQTNSARETFLRINITAKTGDEILKGCGTSLAEYIKYSETQPSGPLPVIKGRSIAISTSVKTEILRVRNVLGMIEGESTDEYIVLGAHYDHMGSSEGYIWNGADDNGSGTVGVMTIAKAIMETGVKPGKTIVIALWTAEEEGLLGSRYFVNNLPFPKTGLKLNMNFDMISRYISDDKPKLVNMTYSDQKPIFRTITENNLKKLNIDLDVEYQPSNDPPGGTDHRSFVDAGIPVIRFKPGHREEYHTPYDETGTIDWDIMEKIIRLCFADVWDLVNTEW